MRKFLGVTIAVLLLATVTFAAPASKPKTTGDADFTNDSAHNTQANITFNAISTKGGPDAKGSLIYTDANITYTMDVQYLLVVNDTAWFAGQVTSAQVTGINPGCCIVGNWIFYKVVDKGEPGYADEVWGEDLTASEHLVTPTDAYNKVVTRASPISGAMALTDGNIQVH